MHGVLSTTKMTLMQAVRSSGRDNVVFLRARELGFSGSTNFSSKKNSELTGNSPGWLHLPVWEQLEDPQQIYLGRTDTSIWKGFTW